MSGLFSVPQASEPILPCSRKAASSLRDAPGVEWPGGFAGGPGR